jgi:hypothetical protein
MPVADVLCLAYSRKYSARCVAGLRLDTLEWVRPVSANDHGELSAASCRLDVGRAPKPLDIVRMPLLRPRPEKHQPENWAVGDRQWQLVDELNVQGAAQYLDEVLVAGPELLGNVEDSHDWDWLQDNGIEESLGLVRVVPHFYVNPWEKLRASFQLRSVPYDLAVTDVAGWTGGAKEASSIVAKSDWYLTVSLGERYDRKNRAYKLVAAGIETPAAT